MTTSVHQLPLGQWYLHVRAGHRGGDDIIPGRLGAAGERVAAVLLYRAPPNVRCCWPFHDHLDSGYIGFCTQK